MTRSALHAGVRACKLKSRQAMIKLSPAPTRGRMTAGTVGRERPTDMHRIFGGTEIRGVTGIAGLGSPGILSSSVALLAVNRRVGASQRELGGSSVIELRAGPAGGRVAAQAISGKPCSRMVWICSRRVIFSMAAETVG